MNLSLGGGGGPGPQWHCAQSRELPAEGKEAFSDPGTHLSPFLTSLTVVCAGQVMTGLTGLHFCLMASCSKIAMNQNTVRPPDHFCRAHSAQLSKTAHDFRVKVDGGGVGRLWK